MIASGLFVDKNVTDTPAVMYNIGIGPSARSLIYSLRLNNNKCEPGSPRPCWNRSHQRLASAGSGLACEINEIALIAILRSRDGPTSFHFSAGGQCMLSYNIWHKTAGGNRTDFRWTDYAREKYKIHEDISLASAKRIASGQSRRSLMSEISGARCHSTIQPAQLQEHHTGGDYVAMTATRRISINLERRKLAKAPVLERRPGRPINFMN
ncbi:hypothetical protein POSPLADRAFT_1036489 [Postia placenta MAD-698-R-SB12]|uniref:Uncharacterized protein n=1 Tax=Postia placenta MAD-698-R-SB12 TaxID=670580 RepID=A0A1X6MNR6_9APHY|nr:hypothetical protein POSPLADRAFT_1036489 [Postia placenta MAD-698-R-SB12]OSX57876.1 hypothetical protein POSPLADRAFT_1036489 [Postia placenta MAD-698-R-SB12]